MGPAPSRGDPNDAEAVRAAARRSLAAGGVRLYRATMREAQCGGWTDPWSWEVGVADPAARSVRVRHFHAEDSPIEKLSESVVRRWPWLDDGTPAPAPGPRAGGETIEIGSGRYYGGSERWIDWSDLRCYGPARALWALEALLATTSATPAARVEVRGALCTRYIVEVRPGDVASLGEATLVDAPEPDDEWRALSADVCLNDSGLVCRIAWSPTTGKRFRPGLLLRLAERFESDRAPDLESAAGGRPWMVTELWDYGCQVEINPPSELVDRPPTSMRTIVMDLWRQKRDYERTRRRR